MKKYLIIIEKTDTGYSSYSPDIAGCIATGSTREEVEFNMEKAIEFHIQGLMEEKLPLPEPYSYSSFVKVAV
jgi:predicted RNase H-like HicB family nuclease